MVLRRIRAGGLPRGCDGPVFRGHGGLPVTYTLLRSFSPAPAPSPPRPRSVCLP